ncbi:hypothetical protein, partial [Pseudoalteromonas tetraodonis]|uniref:hypothetical protein n=1 Tax=Pseudoalteromonas tetraodonis TaxID=43659 RepID=UPI003A978AC1
VEQRLKRFELMLIANPHQIKVLRTLRLISPPSDRARVYGETAKIAYLVNNYISMTAFSPFPSPTYDYF